MKYNCQAVLLILFLGLMSVTVSPAYADLNTDKKGLALEGYDPVAYFPDYGGKPLPGKKDLTAEFAGATYRFANAANREAFLAEPAAFAPAYGGWCAYAMADGKKVEINPKRFEVHDGRLFVFYKAWLTDTLKPWQKDRDQLRDRADAEWAKITS
ncbi:MAG: YHS domain-containing (seleno)protein [Planctomycetota bacterium]